MDPICTNPLHRRLVFVYGTLRHGEPNHALLDHATPLGPAVTDAAFELVDLGPFPAMVRGGATAVVGEVYAVDCTALAELDRLEGHPTFYRRVRTRVQRLGAAANPEAGEEVGAFVYLMKREQVSGRPRIASGDWRRRAVGVREH